MLYIFAGFPGKNQPAGTLGLNAGGLRYCIETVEELAILEHDPAVQYRKKGVFAAGTDELLYDIEYHLSDALIESGITWDWFPPEWAFANGVCIHKTWAGDPNRKGWAAYRARWVEGTCPDENHVVHLTWVVTTHRLPAFAYERIRDIVEGGATPNCRELYAQEADRYMIASRVYDGTPALAR